MLPLALGMPMVLMKHLDRSDTMKLFKGTVLHVHSVHLHPEDEADSRGEGEYVLRHLPECVYLVKGDAEWRIHEHAPVGVFQSSHLQRLGTWAKDGPTESLQSTGVNCLCRLRLP